MLTWENRIERIKEACAIKNNKQLEERLGLANGYINDLLKGKNKNPGKLAASLMKELLINPMWLEDETYDMFGQPDLEKLIPFKPPLLQDLEKYIKEVVSNDLMQIQIRLKTVENTLGIAPLGQKPMPPVEQSLATIQKREPGPPQVPPKEDSTSERPPNYLDHASEPVVLHLAGPEPEYEAEPEERVQIPYVEDIAAGPPIPQSEDQTGLVSVPARFIKKGFQYYAASIKGGSMTEAGIRDKDLVLIRHTSAPVDRAIQVVRHQGKSTLKRLREVEGSGWELHYEDGSGKVVLLDSGDYEVQGEFVAVLPGKAVPEGRKKGRQTHEKPLENR
jgi:SOS-response transcriptional repressor LexA